MSGAPPIESHHATFESIRQFDADGNEFWVARSLSKVLDYSEYRHFCRLLSEPRKRAGTVGIR